jgi:hypothetical protein
VDYFRFLIIIIIPLTTYTLRAVQAYSNLTKSDGKLGARGLMLLDKRCLLGHHKTCHTQSFDILKFDPESSKQSLENIQKLS